MAFNLRNRHFLKLLDFSPQEIKFLLDLSLDLKKAKYAGLEQPRLTGKNIALIFEKPSTRTRCAFTVACIDEGAHPEYLGKGDIQLGKKETVARIHKAIEGLKDLQIIERKDQQYCFAGDFLAMTVPATLQDVIMARVDALPEGAKEVLQTGSVIEREFSYELIIRVTGFAEQELLSRLSILKDSELLYERGTYPESVYIFKHALTHELVYDSILMKKKKQMKLRKP